MYHVKVLLFLRQTATIPKDSDEKCASSLPQDQCSQHRSTTTTFLWGWDGLSPPPVLAHRHNLSPTRTLRHHTPLEPATVQMPMPISPGHSPCPLQSPLLSPAPLPQPQAVLC